MLADWIRSNSNPRIGRNLPGVLVDAGLEPVDLQSVRRCRVRAVETAKDVFPLRPLADHATTHGVIDRPTADNWINDLSEASARGRFVFSVPLFTAVGVKTHSTRSRLSDRERLSKRPDNAGIIPTAHIREGRLQVNAGGPAQSAV